MGNKSKAKGTAWETAIVNYLHDSGSFRARRKTLSGNSDKGDIEVLSVPNVVIEAKNERSYKLSEWVKEANVEAKNADVEFGVVWMHQTGKSNPADGFVVMSGDTFLRLLAILEE